MNRNFTRKNFISLFTLGGAALFVTAKRRAYAQQPPQIPASRNPLDRELVKEFVIKGHSDLPAVKQLLEKEPGLLNACWDWGAGDFETALEGAGHMGNKEIARFLLGKGARINLFCAAMLGQLEVVKGILALDPGLKFSKGPHGLQLLHHATKGGAEAAPVLEYLKSIGAQ
jgi:hypothetical protein